MPVLFEKSKQKKDDVLQTLIPGKDKSDKKNINSWTGVITVAFDGANITIRTLLDKANHVNGKLLAADYASPETGDVENRSNIVETLLGNNTGIKGKDLEDKKILIAALLNGHTEIVRLFKHYGAKE